MSEANPLSHAPVLVCSLERANREFMDGGPMRVDGRALASRVRPGTKEDDLIAVVVYPGKEFAYATAIALVTDLDGHPVWVNPANERRSTAMFIAAACACAVAQADQYEAYA